MNAGSDEDRPQPGRFSRRSLIATSAGVATTMAVTVVAPAAAVAMSPPDAAAIPLPPPTTPLPADPIVAFIHDASRDEVTVLQGTVERTYRDPILVKRLLAAADSQNTPEGK